VQIKDATAILHCRVWQTLHTPKPNRSSIELALLLSGVGKEASEREGGVDVDEMLCNESCHNYRLNIINNPFHYDTNNVYLVLTVLLRSGLAASAPSLPPPRQRAIIARHVRYNAPSIDETYPVKLLDCYETKSARATFNSAYSTAA